MKKCKCGNSVEAAHYDKCNSCWKMQDPRFTTDVASYLKEMSALANKYGIIVAEPLEAMPHTYKPEFGSKIFWDSRNSKYVAALPDGGVLQ